MSIELWKLGAADLASMIRGRKASSRDALESLLGRIEELNPRINAIASVLADEARAAADAADAAVARGDIFGPLHGVPVTVKVNIDVAGSPTTSPARWTIICANTWTVDGCEFHHARTPPEGIRSGGDHGVVTANSSGSGLSA